MDNDQSFDDATTTTEEDSNDENVPYNPEQLPEGCYYKSCAYGSGLDKNVISIISVRRVTLDARYVITVTKRVRLMDIINGLNKRIIPEQ